MVSFQVTIAPLELNTVQNTNVPRELTITTQVLKPSLNVYPALAVTTVIRRRRPHLLVFVVLGIYIIL